MVYLNFFLLPQLHHDSGYALPANAALCKLLSDVSLYWLNPWPYTD